MQPPTKTLGLSSLPVISASAPLPQTPCVLKGVVWVWCTQGATLKCWREGGRDCAGTSCCYSCVGQSQRGVSPWAWGQTGNPSPATGKEKCESRKEQMQDVWKRFPGHSGQNPLFNFPLHPASSVSHCAAPGEGTARPVPASWSPPARQQLTALCDT